jgi:hypothetical protein
VRFTHRVLLLSGLGLALLLSAGSPLPGQDKDKDKKGEPAPTTPYAPLKVGTTWEYLVTTHITEPAKRVEKHKATVRVIREETVRKSRVAVLETTYEGKKIVERLGAQKDGLYRYSGEGIDYLPPLCLLKLPPKDGETWAVKSRGDGLTIEGKFTAGEEEVTVPAGVYEAVTATSTDFRVDAVQMSLTYWFVPGFGLVKQRVRVGGREIVLELEKYTPAR